MSLFRIEGLVKRFGGLLATDHVSLTVERGEVHAPVSYTHLTLPTKA